ncbi:hypothetical protein ACEQ8H_005449 [Pleosporales sp. CAS-2024a]
MNGQAIPGFYWDPEKKKYFKIQSATASRDGNLLYSASNLRKQQRDERVQSVTSARIQRARKERVVRINVNNVMHTCLEREIGARRRSHYVQSAWPDACAFGLARRNMVVERPPNTLIRRFDRDPVSKTLYVVEGDNRIKRRRIHNTDRLSLPGHEDDYMQRLPLDEYALEPWDELHRTTSTVSSLTYLPATGALATTTYGSDRPPVVYLSDPERDGPYVGQQFTPKGCATIWGAAARPVAFDHSPSLTNTVAASHVEQLAVAASSSMMVFTRSESGSWDATRPRSLLETDVLALEWISYTTMALGCRDGKIRLHDTRSGGDSHILTHPHPVSRIRRADDPSRLLISGLHDSLFLYDLRSPRNHHRPEHYNNTDSMEIENLYPSAARTFAKRRKIHHRLAALQHSSHPVLTIPHANMDDLELDVDVHARLGLVAASQHSDSSTAIRVSNLWTGRTVKELKREEGVKAAGGGERIRCVRFMEDDEADGGGVSLWADWNGGIASFGW